MHVIPGMQDAENGRSFRSRCRLLEDQPCVPGAAVHACGWAVACSLSSNQQSHPYSPGVFFPQGFLVLNYWLHGYQMPKGVLHS